MEPTIREREQDGACAPCTQEGDRWRKQCGCLKTSEKLRELLKRFPAAPPPTPKTFQTTCLYAFCAPSHSFVKNEVETKKKSLPNQVIKTQACSKSWHVVIELVQLVQLSVTATALALYYLIYCYMQLVYYTLRSALYFHHADGPMKITIGVVALTSLIVGFNLLIRMEKLIGLF